MPQLHSVNIKMQCYDCMCHANGILLYAVAPTLLQYSGRARASCGLFVCSSPINCNGPLHMILHIEILTQQNACLVTRQRCDLLIAHIIPNRKIHFVLYVCWMCNVHACVLDVDLMTEGVVITNDQTAIAKEPI